MEQLLDWVLLVPLLGLVGGVLGGLRGYSTAKEKAEPLLAVVNVVIAGMFGAAGAEYFIDNSHPTFAPIVGLMFGASGSVIVDAFTSVAPEAVRALVLGWAEKGGGSVKNKGDESEKDD